MHYLPKRPALKGWIRNAMVIAILGVLAGCGGGGGSTTTDPGNGGSGNTTQTGKLVISSQGSEIAIGNVGYFSPAAQNGTAGLAAQSANITGADGSFTYASGSTVSFTLAGKTFTVTGAGKVTAAMLAASQSSDATTQNITANNIELFLLNGDEDHNPNNGVHLNPSFTAPTTDFTSQSFAEALERQLTAIGEIPLGTFSPSLGINTEAPQAEQDSIIQSVPWVDLFRIARPFKALSCSSVTYDANGWPTSEPTANCAIRTTLLAGAILANPTVASENTGRTIPASRYNEVIPEGRYTVLYEGDGQITYGNYAQLVSRASGRDVIDIKFTGSQVRLERMDLSVTRNNLANPIKNIRIVMPGGICEGNPFVRVADASGCPAGKYQDFVGMLGNNRNAIVFNPDYLRFLKDFRVIRMMNLMEASPRNPCTGTGDAYNTCLLQDFTWEQRAKMDQATWGASASSNTPLLERYGRGAPLEVQVELANQLNAHPWFNIPHNATDAYVTAFASYVRDHLKTGLKAHIEYTNEAWNNIFWGSLYVRKKGMDLGLGSGYTNAEYWAGALYYAKRATEIFENWENVFADTSRLVRILGTVQTDIYLTRNMLNYGTTKNHVDAVAMNAYFLACLTRTSHTACANTATIPKTLNEVTTLEEVFAAIDNANDPYGLPKLQAQIAAQATEVARFGKALYAYEGGQHLSVDGATDSTRRALFEAANRDPRMGERYTTLLNAWKAAGGQQFMLYTQAQSFHQWGLFGIKETLLQPRASARKYDAAMTFQETVGKCWWNGC